MSKHLDLVELLSKPESLLNWLNSLEPTTVAGIRGDEKSCPLANFLVQSGVCVYARVHPDHVSIYCYPTWGDLMDLTKTKLAGFMTTGEVETWVERFVLNIDDEVEEEITANKAIEIIKAIS